MKQGTKSYLARTYAYAFVNVFGDMLTFEGIKNIQRVADWLAQRHDALFFLRLPIITNATKQKALVEVMQQFDVPVEVHRLIEVLLHDQRAFLVPIVLKAICMIYYAREHIEIFTITSSHTLLHAQLEKLNAFLAERTGNTIMSTHVIDHALIAGIRMQSTTSLWEYSIRKHLAQVQQLFMR